MHTPRHLAAPLSLLVALAACSGDDPATTPTDTTGGGGGDCADNPTAPVPADLRCLWEVTYEGCTTANGGQGRQLYWMIEGAVAEDGTITGTEKYWWFFPEEWNTDDCVDTLSLSGSAITTDLAQLGCPSCEEAYRTTREVTESNCVIGYSGIFDEDQEGYKQTLIFDTLNSNGEPNEEDKILVFSLTGEGADEYARGNMQPTGDVHGPPYTFTWLGSSCQRR